MPVNKKPFGQRSITAASSSAESLSQSRNRLDKFEESSQNTKLTRVYFVSGLAFVSLILGVWWVGGFNLTQTRPVSLETSSDGRIPTFDGLARNIETRTPRGDIAKLLASKKQIVLSHLERQSTTFERRSKRRNFSSTEFREKYRNSNKRKIGAYFISSRRYRQELAAENPKLVKEIISRIDDFDAEVNSMIKRSVQLGVVSKKDVMAAVLPLAKTEVTETAYFNDQRRRNFQKYRDMVEDKYKDSVERRCKPNSREEFSYYITAYFRQRSYKKYNREPIGASIRSMDAEVSRFSEQALNHGVITWIELPKIVQRSLDGQRYSKISPAAKLVLECQMRYSFDKVGKYLRTLENKPCSRVVRSALGQNLNAYFRINRLFAKNNVKYVASEQKKEIFRVAKRAIIKGFVKLERMPEEIKRSFPQNGSSNISAVLYEKNKCRS